MATTVNYYEFVPKIVPMKNFGTIRSKIRLKKEHVRQDNCCVLYVDIYQKTPEGSARKRLNLQIAVAPKFFDSIKQRVKLTHKFSKDYNLIIEKMLADINTIQVNYRLNNEVLTINQLVEELTNPGLRIDFYKFYNELLQYQKNKGIIKHETFKQQRSTLKKLKQFKRSLKFKDITKKYIIELRAWLKTEKKQAPATIEIVIKNLKKYIHIANEKGIKTPIKYSQIKVKKTESNFTFLLPEELRRFYQLYKDLKTCEIWRNILQRYLFSSFTGLRISDIKAIKQSNFIDNNLVFVSVKSGKLQRIKLNETALSLVSFPEVFKGSYAEQTINRELKLIAHACGINKRVYYHSARHSFATNYLIAGGQIQNLQKLLGHSKIETTMLYSHVVGSLMDKELELMDAIFS